MEAKCIGSRKAKIVRFHKEVLCWIDASTLAICLRASVRLAGSFTSSREISLLAESFTPSALQGQ